MKNTFDNVLECIGSTPLVRINRINPNPRVALYAKLEARNPGGSIKDRAALYMIEAAERDGSLHEGKIVIEATSGNTGIGLAMVAAVKGYRIMLAMSETASMERRKILKALGAEIILTPGALGTDGAIEEVYRLVRESPELYFMPDQFNNPANPLAHERTTGPEIYEQTEGRVDTVVLTLGTTGTAMGILKAMKDRNPAIQVVAVEPYPGHKIQGLKNMKESYVPGIFDRYALDRVVPVRDEDAFEAARRLAREEGIFAGMSSGAAMAAAMKLAAEREEGLIVALLPDGGDRYLSTNLFTTMLEPDFKFHDFLRREKVDFKPVQEGKARVFVAGPPLDRDLTLQDARRLLLADLLARFLQLKKFSVREIVLMADLDTRTIQASGREGAGLAAYAQRRMDGVLKDLDRLGISRAHLYPKTSEYTDVVEEFCRKLLGKSAAYEKLRSVYFDISKRDDYGSLSRVDPKGVRPGVSVDLSAYEKLNPRDFTLLKRATLAELKRGIYMKTPWGNVIPTWHIAAAAVGIGQLGAPIDVHVSSLDFLFPHLENVRAIGEALTGKPFANVWMLCEQTRVVKGTDDPPWLSESPSIRDMLDSGVSPQQIRYWLLSIHYRKSFQVSEESFRNACKGYRRMGEFIGRLHHAPAGGDDDRKDNGELKEHEVALEKRFLDSLADDLNVPNALAAVFGFIRRVNPLLDRGALSRRQRSDILDSLRKLDAVLGVFDLELEPLDETSEELIRRREAERARRNWPEADRLRDALLERGVRVVDAPGGTRWERVGRRC